MLHLAPWFFVCRLLLPLLASTALSLSAAANEADEQSDLRALLMNREFVQLDAALLHLDQSVSAGTYSERLYLRRLNVLTKLPAEQEQLLAEWVRASQRPMLARMVRGGFYHEQGWRNRGNKYSNQTSQEQFSRMQAHFAQAREELNAVLTGKPDCMLCYGYLINIAMASSDTDKKTQLFQQALKQNPRAYYPVTRYFASLEPRWGGGPDSSEKFLNWFRSNYPNNPALPVIEADLLMEKVDAYSDKNDFLSAQPLVQRALALDPLHKQAWTMQSWILDRTQDYPGALHAAEQAIKNGADDDWTLSHRAQLLIKLGRGSEGMQALEQAIDGQLAFRAGLRVLSGTLHNQKPNYPAMWDFCQRGMQAGLPEAFACTGTFHYFGWLKPVDYPEAFKWWKIAAERGVPESMVDIGILYWEGRGTPKDREQAIAWWIKGAEAGDPRGVSKLQAHLSPWEFYTNYTLPDFQRELLAGEAGDSPSAAFSRFLQITWDSPIGAWIATWWLPILLGWLLIVLLVIKREQGN